jgi:hypothetical protein
MEECPNCGQIPDPEDDHCRHCNFPFDEEAQRQYKSPYLKQIEADILARVIQRVEGYWQNRPEAGGETAPLPHAGASGPVTDFSAPATHGAGTAALPKGRALSDLIRWLAWLHLALGLVAALVIWQALGTPAVSAGQGLLGAGYTGPLLVVLAVFGGVAGCALLLAAGVILEMIAAIRDA